MSDRNEGRRHLEDAEYRIIKNYEGWSDAMEGAIRTIAREEVERARVADMEGDAPDPAPADEPEGLEVVAFQKFDGGHLYYNVGYTSDPRAEHLVKKSDAMALLSEKDAEINGLKEEKEQIMRLHKYACDLATERYYDNEKLRARIAELEARERQCMDARVPFNAAIRSNPEAKTDE